MTHIKKIIRKSPTVYNYLRDTYYGLFHAAEAMGFKLHESKWKKKNFDFHADFIEAMKHPHREYLIKKVENCHPLGNVLEVGCGSGQNLIILSKIFPEIMFHGIDINPTFIDEGRKWCDHNGVTNVSLNIGEVTDLSMFADNFFFLAFSDAILIYVAPQKIKRALSEMIRVTNRTLLLNEWHNEGVKFNQQSSWYYGHWVHNYRVLFEEMIPTPQFNITKIPENLWEPGGGWELYGSFMEVNLVKR